jgi:hypothetical protein
MLDVIAYAEARALIAAGLGVRVEAPEMLARAALVSVLERDTPFRGVPWNPSPGAFCDQIRAQIRASTTRAMRERARSVSVERGVGALLSAAQLGSLDGIELLAHVAGEQAGPIRETDMATVSKAIELTDFARGRLGG